MVNSSSDYDIVSGRVDSELFFFFFQAEDGIRDLVRSRGLGDVYKRQPAGRCEASMYTIGMSMTGM